MKVVGSAETVTIAERWHVPRELTVEADDHGGVDVRVIAEYRPESGRYEARQVTVRRRDGGPEVTGEALRLVPVAGILRNGVAQKVLETVPATLAPAEVRDRLVAAGPTDETLSTVAQIYVLAVVLGDPPTQRVSDTLRIPRATAGRWVTRARDRGLLTVQDPRGARKA